jgi:hypothetical protein
MRTARTITLAIGLIAATTALAACGATTTTTPDDKSAQKPQHSAEVEPKQQQDAPEPALPTITQATYKKHRSALESGSMKGALVSGLVGKVFNIDQDGEGIAAQMYTDDDLDHQVIVAMPDGATVDEDEYLKVSGTVSENFTGENAMGADLEVPTIVADDAQRTSSTAMHPARYTAPSRTQTVNGIKFTIRKIAFAADETRMYIKVTNNSGEDQYIGTPKVIANGTQRREDYGLMRDDLPEFDGDLSAGASTSGVIVFHKMPRHGVQVKFEAGYDADFNDMFATFYYA